jgi:Ca-activated chloride channel family protein
MIFDRPDLLLWLLALLPVALFIALAANRRRKLLAAWGTDAVQSGESHGRRRALRNGFFALALVGLVFALAQPRGGAVSRILSRQGSDVVFVLDLSKSMLAKDVAPSRLQRAIFEIERMLDNMAGDRAALVVFAGTAFTQVPLTTDFAVVRNLLHSVDPFDMPYPGSHVAAGIERGLQLIKSAPRGGRALVLLTDGEQTSGDALAMARAAGEENIPVFVVALGTARGEPIQVQNGLLAGPDGKPYFSRLDEEALQGIARESGGRYFRLGAGGDTNAVNEMLDRLDKKTLDERTITERAELYGLALLPALFFFAVGLWINERASL